MSLFRQEVIKAKQQQWMGEILLARPISLAFLTATALVIAIVLLSFLAWGEFTRKEHVIGRIVLTQGLAKVYSPVVGTVVQKLVNEGQVVKKGQPLYVISVERMTSKGDTQIAIGEEIAHKRQSLQAQLATQRRVYAEEEASLRKKIDDLQNQLVHLRGEIATQSKRLAINAASLARFRELSASNFISPSQLAEREQDNLEQQSRLQALQRTEISVSTDIATATSELKNAPLNARNQLANIERGISSVEQENFENEARREITVTALQDGQVTAVLSEIGQTVTPNAPMLTLLPSNPHFEAHLYVASRAVGFMQEGAQVQMRYEAFPYQKFGQYRGVIKSISRAALSPSELQLLNSPPETLYRVTVALDQQYVIAYGQQLHLQDGMQLEADVLLDKRKLYEWVLEPFYSLTGKM
jgi:membrane fusion protein